MKADKAIVQEGNKSGLDLDGRKRAKKEQREVLGASALGQLEVTWWHK